MAPSTLLPATTLRANRAEAPARDDRYYASSVSSDRGIEFFQAITAIPSYSNDSLEELRWQDTQQDVFRRRWRGLVDSRNVAKEIRYTQRDLLERVFAIPSWWTEYGGSLSELAVEVASRVRQQLFVDAVGDAFRSLAPVVRRTLSNGFVHCDELPSFSALVPEIIRIVADPRQLEELNTGDDVWLGLLWRSLLAPLFEPLVLEETSGRGTWMILSACVRGVSPEEMRAGSYEFGVDTVEDVKRSAENADPFQLIAWIHIVHVLRTDSEPWPDLWGKTSCTCRFLAHLEAKIVDQCCAVMESFESHGSSQAVTEVLKSNIPSWLQPVLPTSIKLVQSIVGEIAKFAEYELHRALDVYPAVTANVGNSRRQVTPTSVPFCFHVDGAVVEAPDDGILSGNAKGLDVSGLDQASCDVRFMGVEADIDSSGDVVRINCPVDVLRKDILSMLTACVPLFDAALAALSSMSSETTLFHPGLTMREPPSLIKPHQRVPLSSYWQHAHAPFSSTRLSLRGCERLQFVFREVSISIPVGQPKELQPIRLSSLYDSRFPVIVSSLFVVDAENVVDVDVVCELDDGDGSVFQTSPCFQLRGLLGSGRRVVVPSFWITSLRAVKRETSSLPSQLKLLCLELVDPTLPPDDHWVSRRHEVVRLCANNFDDDPVTTSKTDSNSPIAQLHALERSQSLERSSEEERWMHCLTHWPSERLYSQAVPVSGSTIGFARFATRSGVEWSSFSRTSSSRDGQLLKVLAELLDEPLWWTLDVENLTAWQQWLARFERALVSAELLKAIDQCREKIEEFQIAIQRSTATAGMTDDENAQNAQVWINQWNELPLIAFIRAPSSQHLVGETPVFREEPTALITALSECVFDDMDPWLKAAWLLLDIAVRRITEDSVSVVFMSDMGSQVVEMAVALIASFQDMLTDIRSPLVDAAERLRASPLMTHHDSTLLSPNLVLIASECERCVQVTMADVRVALQSKREACLASTPGATHPTTKRAVLTEGPVPWSFLVDDGLVPSDATALRIAVDALPRPPTSDGTYCLLVNPADSDYNGPSCPILRPFSIDQSSDLTLAERLFKIVGREDEREQNPVSAVIGGLPCDIMIDSCDGSARFLSYIETLHPVHQADVYSTLETLLTTCFVPMLEKLVPALRVSTPPPMLLEEDPAHTTRTTLAPWTLRGRVIQCVFEVIEIRLDPDRPEFPGIKWEDDPLVGLSSLGPFAFQERFCVANDSVAVGIHVVACDNLAAPPQLSLLLPKRVTDAHADWLPPGSITLHPQRTAVFAAAYEQRLGQFELQNPVKSGRLVLLKFHLIYPTRRSLSTADVPPLRRDWVSEACIAPVVKAFGLPSELIKTLEAFVGPPSRAVNALRPHSGQLDVADCSSEV